MKIGDSFNYLSENVSKSFAVSYSLSWVFPKKLVQIAAGDVLNNKRDFGSKVDGIMKVHDALMV